MKKLYLRLFGIFGMSIFIPLFFFTFADPQVVEKSGRAFIEWKLFSETNNRIESIRAHESNNIQRFLGQKTEELRRQAEQQIEKTKAQLKAELPVILAGEIAKMRNLDCDCRKKWERFILTSMEWKIASLEDFRNKLINFTQSRYMDIVQKLTRDVRIFLGANAVIFVSLFLVSLLKPQAVYHLFLPGALILTSTIVCSYFYIFEQNWFYTIVFNSYTGFAYISYLVFVFAMLCDIVFNKARVTARVINVIMDVFGHSVTLLPC